MSIFDLNLNDIKFDDIDTLLNKEIEKTTAVVTSEKYAKQAKQFLNELRIINTKLDNSKQFHQVLHHGLELRLPNKDEQIRIRTQTQISLLAIVLKIASLQPIDELTIATYTLNKKEAFETLCQMVKSGHIKKLNFLIASSYTFRDAEYYEFLKSTCLKLSKDYEIHLTFAWSHFKITLAKCRDDYYHIEGSINYSQNNMAENLIFENNKNIYDFDYNFITKVMNEQTNKALEIIC